MGGCQGIMVQENPWLEWDRVVFYLKRTWYDPDNYRPFMPAVVIGDRVRSELAVGKSLGATTIWVKQGKFAEEGPENDQQQPDNIVSSLHACATLLRKPL